MLDPASIWPSAVRPLRRIEYQRMVADDSEPQPDLAVVPVRNYSAEVPSHAHLVIEVAEAQTSRPT